MNNNKKMELINNELLNNQTHLILRIFQEDTQKIFLVDNDSLRYIQTLETCTSWLVCKETIVTNFTFLEKKERKKKE